MIHPNLKFNVTWPSKVLPKAKLIELLSLIPDGSLVHPNCLGNLLILDREGNPLGFIDFNLNGEYEVYQRGGL